MRKGTHARTLGVLVATAVCFGSVSGCSLDERDLQAFQTTATGPEKLRAILLDGTRPARLRADAALNLLDLERPDLNGREVLFDDLKRLSSHARNQIVPTFQAGLATRMLTSRYREPSDRALRAKDAGVELLPLLGESERNQLGAELLGWMVEDLDARADRGVYSLEAVAARMGLHAAPVLVKALSAEQTPRNLERLVQIIDARADGPTRAAAAVRLVQVEGDYRSLRQRRVIEEQLRREGAFASNTESTLVEAQIDARRKDALQKRLLPALGRFADQPAASARLLAIAEQPSYDLEERTLAFALLEGHVDERQIPALLKLALDDKTPVSVRELAIARAGESRSRDLLPSLLILTSDHLHAGLRQKAAELLLEIGGPQSLQAFFRALPRQWNMNFAKSEIDAYSERVNRYPSDLSLLLLLGEKVHSVFWWNRVIALRYFAARGTAEDAWRIRQHLGDLIPVTGEGWPTEYTVGNEAEAALAIALERFRRPGSTPAPTPPAAPAKVAPAPSLPLPRPAAPAPGRMPANNPPDAVAPKTAPVPAPARHPASAPIAPAPTSPGLQAPQQAPAGDTTVAPEP
ncbi:MAG: hypothetical protein QM778_35445 [Myxococcales bacterium]